MFFAGKSALAPENLKPQRSMNQINRDVAMAREVASNDTMPRNVASNR
jgi:hypothetical protein